MKRPAVALSILAFVACSPASQPASAERPKILIVAVGDSTTAGTPFFQSPLEAPPDGKGDPEAQYGYWMMRKHPDWDVRNFGIAGQRSDEIALRLEDALKLGPRFVVVLAGVNDIFQGADLEKTERNLLWMYRKAKTVMAVPVACTVLPFDKAAPDQVKKLKKLNDWIRATSDKERIPLAELNKAVADPANPDRLNGSPDGLHPDIGGYRKMGEGVARAIQPLTDIGRH